MFLVTILVVLLYANTSIQRYSTAEPEDTETAIIQEVELRIYRNSVHNFTTSPLSSPKDFLRQTDNTKGWVFVTFGLNESPKTAGLIALLSALIDRKQYNVVLLDWSRWANVGPIGQMTKPMFVKTINRIQTIACEFGLVLVGLNNTDVNDDNRTFALVGHSIGAQMMAEASACATEHLSLDMIIWGLDPAGDIYERQFGPMPYVPSGVAKYVYILHTDPSGFGTSEATGTVDFWPNYSRNMKNQQPGCENPANKDSLNVESLCNHARSWYFFADGIRHPKSMPAIKAFDGEAWLAGRVEILAPWVFLTLEPDEEALGQYFFATKRNAPFGMDAKGTRPLQSELFLYLTPENETDSESSEEDIPAVTIPTDEI